MSYNVNLKASSNKQTTIQQSSNTVPFYGDEQPIKNDSSASDPLTGGKGQSYDALILIVLFVIVISAALLVTGAYFFFLHEDEVETPIALVPAAIFEAPILKPDNGIARDYAAFQDVSLIARSAFVYDPHRKQPLFARDANEEFALASVTKLMTAVVAKDILGDDATVTISQSALQTEGESGLILGEEWNSDELLSFMLITSSNDAAQALAEAAGRKLNSEKGQKQVASSLDRLAFVQAMNRKASELNMEQTYFENASGLDLGPTVASAYGSAEDIAKLMQYILETNPDVLLTTRDDSRDFTSLSNNTHTAKNTNTRVDEIPGLLGTKTGFTDVAGGNLAVVYDIGFNQEIIIVVLGSTREDRFTDAERLARASRAFMTGE